jgi:hypothetical protein
MVTSEQDLRAGRPRDAHRAAAVPPVAPDAPRERTARTDRSVHRPQESSGLKEPGALARTCSDGAGRAP